MYRLPDDNPTGIIISANTKTAHLLVNYYKYSNKWKEVHETSNCKT